MTSVGVQPEAAASSPAPPPAILLDGVSFAYQGDAYAVREVGLRVEPGEFVALMGPNGAGKTTLCLLLNGVIPNVIGGQLAGSIEIQGLATVDHPVYELAEHVGVVLQDPDAQILASNVVSEVAFAAENLGIPREEIAKRIARALAVVRLTGFEDRAPEELSGGQKQRLAIAAGLVMEPRILVLDEPTAQLDPIGNVEVFDVLERLNREAGTTVVIATHNSDDVARTASRVVVLEGGRVVADGPPREVFVQIELLDRIGINVPEVIRIQIELGVPPDAVGLDVPSAVQAIERTTGAARVIPTSEPPDTAPVPAAHERPSVIDVTGLRYRYPGTGVFALDGIDIRVGRGEFVALIGQNGSGKTTLVKCLAGLLLPDAGEIRVDGELVTRASSRALPRRIGVVLQNPDTQLFQMSVRSEIEFGLKNLGVPPEDQEVRIADALRITGLEDVAELYPFKLSFGDRRKVAVAAIAAMATEVLVFDEPTTGQDFTGRYRLCDIGEALNEAGTTVLMITHDMDLVARYAQRVVVLGLGRVIFDGPTREAFARPEMLRETYLQPPQAAQLAQALSSFGVAPDLLTVREVVDALGGGRRERVASA